MQCDIDCLITQEPSAPVSIDRKVTEMTSRRRDTSRLCQHFENNFRVCELVSFASRRTGGPDLSWLLHTVSLMASRKATEIMDLASILIISYRLPLDHLSGDNSVFHHVETIVLGHRNRAAHIKHALSFFRFRLINFYVRSSISNYHNLRAPLNPQLFNSGGKVCSVLS